MRIATRLTLALIGTIVVVAAAYIAASQSHRRGVFQGELQLETATLASALEVASHELLSSGDTATLDRMLRTVLGGRDLVGAAVLAGDGRVLAGGSVDEACLSRIPLVRAGAGAGAGRIDCGAPVQWIARPVGEPDATLVVAMGQVLLERTAADALNRQLLLVLVLILAIALATVQILRVNLSEPLDLILGGIRALGMTGTAPIVQVDRSAGELADLADNFNDMAAQLEAKRTEIRRATDDRIALERRLQEAERFAMLGRLSGGLAHELGSPLSTIGMRAEAVSANPSASTAVREHAGAIGREVGRMTEFIQGLLHVARRHGIVYEPVDVRDLVLSLREELEQRSEGTGVRVSVVTPSEPVVVRGQETLLRHAIRNLVRNAVQATRLRERDDLHVELRLESDDSEVRILVEDTGPGIPEELIAHVFEPFYTTKEIGSGTGLGLPVSRGIVEEHGGELTLSNRAVGGACARIVLPRAPVDEVDDRTARTAPGAGGRGSADGREPAG